MAVLFLVIVILPSSFDTVGWAYPNESLIIIVYFSVKNPPLLRHCLAEILFAIFDHIIGLPFKFSRKKATLAHILVQFVEQPATVRVLLANPVDSY